jgi:hypothetical protein
LLTVTTGKDLAEEGDDHGLRVGQDGVYSCSVHKTLGEIQGLNARAVSGAVTQNKLPLHCGGKGGAEDAEFIQPTNRVAAGMMEGTGGGLLMITHGGEPPASDDE